MNPIDAAWRVLKAPPIWTEHEDEVAPHEPRDFTMLPHLAEMGGTMWESQDGNARGLMRGDWDNNALQISHFEVGKDNRGQGKAPDYIQEMKRDGHEWFEYEFDQTHVTHVEPSSARFWNHMVDSGVLHGAHEVGHIRTTPAGEPYTHAFNDTNKIPVRGE